MSKDTNEDSDSFLIEKNNAIVTDVKYLNQVSTLDAIKEYKLTSFKVLEIEKGFKILDVGCGTGDDVKTMAKDVGNEGKVVGIDVNEEAIKTAKEKFQDKNLLFINQNVEQIPFDDNYFDAVRSDRVFMHLINPIKVFDEMIRVTKPKGKIMVLDVDWDSLLVHSDNKKVTRAVLRSWSDSIHNSWMGRQLYPLFKERKLLDIKLDTKPLFLTDLKTADYAWSLKKTLEKVVQSGEITKQEAEDWWNELEQKDKEGLFVAFAVGMSVVGTKN